MAAAVIIGTPASPKGLRHGFGVNAIASGVRLPLLQKWMGHASLRTTAYRRDGARRARFRCKDVG